MTDKEVRKLSKVQLIEILYLLSKENDELREENQQLKARLDSFIDEMVAERKERESAETAAEKAAPASKSQKNRK